MSSHKEKATEMVKLIAAILEYHGMEKDTAVDRAKNVASPIMYGEILTPFMVAEMLDLKRNSDGSIAVEGIEDISARSAASIEIYNLWKAKKDGQSSNQKIRTQRAVFLVAKRLHSYGLDRSAATDRARNMAAAAACDDPLTPAMAAEMLTPTESSDGTPIIRGFADIRIRSKASLDVSRIWLTETADSTHDAWTALWTYGSLTKSAAINWLKKEVGLSQESIDQLNTSTYSKRHVISYTNLEKAVERLDGVLANVKKFDPTDSAT